MYPIVEIHWEDHHDAKGDDGEHIHTKPTPPEELYPVIVESVGWLVSENDVMVEIARDFTPGEDMYEPLTGALRIMKKNIVLLKKF